VIKPSSRCVDQVNGEELDDEKVIIHLACLAREAIVLQPNAGVVFVIVLYDFVGRLKTLRETRVVYVASKRLRLWLLEAKATPFLITMPAATCVTCVVLGAFPSPHASLMMCWGLKVTAWVALSEIRRGPHR
jgi:hypothetical protein